MTLSVLLVWISLFAQGREVLIPASDSPPLEWKAYLQAHPEFLTPSAALEKQRPSSTNRERLIRLFAEAQSDYLSNDLDRARERYQAVANETLNEDWAEQDREILLISHLRLAQLAIRAEDRIAWLRAAASVGDVSVDSRLFPPPLWSEWKSVLNSLDETALNFAQLGRDWTRVLINGRSCTRNPCRVTMEKQARVRVTWVSDVWVPFTRITRVDQIESAIADKRPWLKGSCAQLEWTRDAEEFSSRVGFFSLACAQRSLAGLDEKRLTPLPTPAAPLPWRNPQPKSDRPLYKSVWLWLGVGTLAAIVVAHNQKSKETREPTTTYGY